MPFKSKAQQRFMFSAEDSGKLPKGTAERWALDTGSGKMKKLPERVGEKKKPVEKRPAPKNKKN